MKVSVVNSAQVAATVGTTVLTLSIAIMQVTTTVAYTQVLRWYFL